jgi:hypothetical protein
MLVEFSSGFSTERLPSFVLIAARSFAQKYVRAVLRA